MSQIKRNRSDFFCPVFGDPAELSTRVLPSYEDIMKCFLLVRNELKNNTKSDPPVGAIAVYVAEKVETIWQAASIPTVSWERIVKMIRSYNGR